MDPNESGILKGLSPEEILARKEMEGGIVYDDPFIPETPINPVPSAEDLQKRQTPLYAPPVNVPPVIQETPPPIKPTPPVPPIEDMLGLGKVETRRPSQHEFSPGWEFGWKNLPLSVLPSRGFFYPEGTKIAIRSAEVKEIRHFSTIDEDDLIDLDEKLNFILSKCSTMHFPNEGVVSYKDLKHEDRFFLIMAIRDLTFVQGENRIIISPESQCKDKNACPINNGIELRTGVLSSYDIDPRVMKYYSPVSRNFVFPVRKIGKEIMMSVPSIGVMDAISEFVIDCERKSIDLEESFVKIAPFIFDEWRGLDNKKIMQRMRESDDWSKEEFSLYYELCETIKIGTELDINVKCPTCGAEVTAPITFPGGFKSLFVISDIFRELL
jgi:hypothetical protein